MYPPLRQDGTPPGRAFQSRLSVKRKAKLLDIQQREALKDDLANKIRDQMAAKRGMTPLINREVDRLCEVAPITKRNLKRLEQRLEYMVQNCDDDVGSTISGISDYTEGTLSVMSDGSLLSAASGSSLRSVRSVGSLPPIAERPGSLTHSMEPYGSEHLTSEIRAVLDRDSGNPDVQLGDWSRLDTYAAFLNSEETQRHRAGISAQQAKFRADLDQQIAEREAKARRLAEEDRAYAEQQRMESENWQELEQQRQQEMLEKMKREKALRDAQYDEEMQRRQAEAEAKQQLEARMVAKINDEIDQERQRLISKRNAQREMMQQLMKDNQVVRHSVIGVFCCSNTLDFWLLWHGKQQRCLVPGARE
mmetsp:Transcript_104572/g.239667  ORF Transcript_104572/g.239667 Transcript_104572/m.239667 type:complete len:363 (-) Transcript_104572:704-1792(-)